MKLLMEEMDSGLMEIFKRSSDDCPLPRGESESALEESVGRNVCFTQFHMSVARVGGFIYLAPGPGYV